MLLSLGHRLMNSCGARCGLSSRTRHWYVGGKMQKTAIHDLTREFLHPSTDWRLRGRERESQFRASTSAILDGLYVAVYVNESLHEIWDSNGKKSRTVIPAKSAMLKYGKFEGGVLRRYREQFAHLRRRPPNGQDERWIYREVTRLVLVLDLTPVALQACSCASVFEPFWNGSIKMWLSDARLLHVDAEGGRGESLRLLRTPTKIALMKILPQLQVRIEAAAGELA